MTLEILKSFEEPETYNEFLRDYGYPMITLVFTEYVFNLDIDMLNNPYEDLQDTLMNIHEQKKEGWEMFIGKMAIALQGLFETVLGKMDQLHKHYESDPDNIAKIMLATEWNVVDFMSRAIIIIKFLKRFEFNEIGQDSMIKSVVTTYLPKFMTHPCFYLMGKLYSAEFGEIVTKLTVTSYLLPNLLDHYLSTLSNFCQTFLQIMNQVQDNDDLFFTRKVWDVIVRSGFGVFDGTYYLDNYFNETYLDDPKQCHATNSLLFLPYFVNSWGLYQWWPNLAKDQYQTFMGKLMENIEPYLDSLVNLQYIITKKSI